MLKGKKIVLGVTGSIAAYKSAHLIRLLIKEGAEVKVLMTEAATQFITPLTLSTLSKNNVFYNIADEASWNNHVALGRWADILLIAPLSCNTLAKMANGLCDNLLLAVYLSSVCKVMVAPAMDEDMWKHPSTKMNLKKLTEFGNHIIPVNHGELASGLVGDGRMAEPEEIIVYLKNYLNTQNDLLNKNVLITAGPTYEALDPVRFIGNHSSGKMGIALANNAKERGAKVTLILGPTNIPFQEEGIRLIRVTSASEMYTAVIRNFKNTDIAIMSAAVADYTPINVSKQKIKKNDGTLEIHLTKTKDILKQIGQSKTSKQIVVGFALETNNEKDYALKKLKEKNADFIILNSTNDQGGTFGSNLNKITIFDKLKKEIRFEMKPKIEVAKDIWNVIVAKLKK